MYCITLYYSLQKLALKNYKPRKSDWEQNRGNTENKGNQPTPTEHPEWSIIIDLNMPVLKVQPLKIVVNLNFGGRTQNT